MQDNEQGAQSVNSPSNEHPLLTQSRRSCHTVSVQPFICNELIENRLQSFRRAVLSDRDFAPEREHKRKSRYARMLREDSSLY